MIEVDGLLFRGVMAVNIGRLEKQIGSPCISVTPLPAATLVTLPPWGR